MPKIPRNLSDINPELATDFEDNSLFQEGIISEMYQRLDKSYFKESQEQESLVNTGRLVQKFSLKQTGIVKTLKIIQSITRDTFTCYCKRNTGMISSELPFQRFIYVSSSK